MATVVEPLQDPVHQRQFAALLDQFLCWWILDGPIKCTQDQVWMIADLAHLHQHVVQPGNMHVIAVAIPGDDVKRLLNQQANRSVH